MATLDEDKQQCSIKIVYYGPALSGKTSNLISLHNILKPELKGDMQVLETENDRTLFFDLLPMGIRTVDNWLIKLKLFTVPGQVVHDSTRKAVLSRADGVVFVADSQQSQSENNAEAFDNLVRNSAQVGLDFSSLPLVVQFNKRDLKNVLSENEILERWKPTKWALHFASAVHDDGVLDTFSTLLRQIYHKLDSTIELSLKHQLSEDLFVQQITGRV